MKASRTIDWKRAHQKKMYLVSLEISDDRNGAHLVRCQNLELGQKFGQEPQN